jgi:hypothetical protein
MNARDLIEALLAVLGVYELLQGIGVAIFYLPMSLSSEGHEGGVPFAGGAVLIGIGALLLVNRRWLAHRLSPSSQFEAVAPPIDLLEALLAVAGVCFAVSALVSGAGVVGDVLFREGLRSHASGEALRYAEVWPPLVRPVVEFVLGIGLALRSSGVAGALRSFRAAGRRAREEQDADA